MRLLARLVERESGMIRIDGVDVHDYSFAALRRQVVFVSQEPGLLSATIADNIRLGRPDADATAVHQAARLSGAAEFIERLPLAYDSVVGERGLTLSGGERQRLTLARAILLNPPILILDEPSNHLDSSAILALRNLIDRRREEGLTTIIISHEALPADRTVFMEKDAVPLAG
jgi:ATP-binding cassette subfamily B protein